MASYRRVQEDPVVVVAVISNPEQQVILRQLVHRRATPVVLEQDKVIHFIRSTVEVAVEQVEQVQMAPILTFLPVVEQVEQVEHAQRHLYQDHQLPMQAVEVVRLLRERAALRQLRD
jgi:hypothetical protein